MVRNKFEANTKGNLGRVVLIIVLQLSKEGSGIGKRGRRAGGCEGGDRLRFVRSHLSPEVKGLDNN